MRPAEKADGLDVVRVEASAMGVRREVERRVEFAWCIQEVQRVTYGYWGL